MEQASRPGKTDPHASNVGAALEPPFVHLFRACSHFGHGGGSGDGQPRVGQALAVAAAVVAVVTPVIGREVLSADSEARWIRARATAVTIKSECFRFAAQLGEYAGATVVPKGYLPLTVVLTDSFQTPLRLSCFGCDGDHIAAG